MPARRGLFGSAATVGLPCIGLLADSPVERQRAEQRHAVLLAQVAAAVLAENVLLVTAAAANVQAHVLDDAEHGHVHLLEHLEPLARVRERDVLRRRDDDGAAHGHALRERELNVTRARRHVDDEVVEVAPARLGQQLVQRRRHHRPAPRHGLLLVDEKADRHRLHAVGHERLEQLAVARLRAAFPRAPACAAGSGRRCRRRASPTRAPSAASAKREVHGYRRLADAALAGRDGDHVVGSRQRLQPVLNGVRRRSS